MHRSALVPFLISLFFCFCQLQTDSESTTPTPRPYLDMEIITIEVLPRIGNTVVLSWGKPLREYSLNWTYGIYYGLNVDEALKEPKITTKDLYAEITNLTYCSLYVFGVGVVDDSDGDGDVKSAHPKRNLRTIGTLVDELAPPQKLNVEFIPEQEPCLLIRWTASCPNIALPLGYLVTVHESDSPHMMLISHPRTTASDLAQTLRVTYGKSYDIKVATDAISAQPTPITTFKVPHFLQPYKVRLTSQPEGAFVMYWREPFVPYFVGDYFYEVYIYPGRDLTQKPQIFPTDRPVFQFQGNLSEYTFMVGLRSVDGRFKSYLTEPVAQNLLGENVTLSVT